MTPYLSSVSRPAPRGFSRDDEVAQACLRRFGVPPFGIRKLTNAAAPLRARYLAVYILRQDLRRPAAFVLRAVGYAPTSNVRDPVRAAERLLAREPAFAAAREAVIEELGLRPLPGDGE